MKNKMDLIGSWVTKAKKDLISVEHELSFEDPVVESICFHSQQTVEELTIEDARLAYSIAKSCWDLVTSKIKLNDSNL